MTDELDRMAESLKATSPLSNPDRKAKVIALARKKFDESQEKANTKRPIHEPTQNASGVWTGVIDMLRSINLRPVLYATSAICVAGLAFVVTQPLTNSPLQPVHVDEVESNEVLSTDSVIDTEQYIQPTLKAPVEVTEPTVQAVKPTIETRQIQKAESDAVGNTSALLSNNLYSKSATKRIVAEDSIILPAPQSGETFSNGAPNPLKIASEEPVSTFSIDVDTASYSYVRNAIKNGHIPPAEAVRIEEMINYFPYDYSAPDISKVPFSTAVSVFQTPWNPDTKILHIGIQGAKPEIDTRPPLNLVFLIDTSGSMQDPNKLPLLKQSFRLLLNTLRPEDKVAIVTYAGSAGTVLEPTTADQREKILSSLERLEAGGSTAGQAGLQQAYSLAGSMQTDNSIGRVLLATDGDFNVGISDPDALKSFVEDKRESGIYLSVFGFGQGNYRDDMMQSLAQNGNGTAAYIDTLSEAQKVMVDQVSGAIFPIANDVKIQVEFNPTEIAEYRLIGYETRMLNREDFNNDAVDAGDIGAGHNVTAIYEITPIDSPAVKNDDLRYQPTAEDSTVSDEYGYLKLRYKSPGETKSNLIETPILDSIAKLDDNTRFATAIAGFGQLLTKSKYLNGWTWSQNIDLAIGGKGEDAFGYRTEAIQLMRLAKSLQ